MADRPRVSDIWMGAMEGYTRRPNLHMSSGLIMSYQEHRGYIGGCRASKEDMSGFLIHCSVMKFMKRPLYL